MNSEEFVQGSVEARTLRLTWKGILAVIGATIVIAFPFAYFGKFELARPTIFSLAMIILAIVMNWRLRRRVWFWITVSAVAALHLALIIGLPWTTNWVPATVMKGLGAADLVVTLGIVKLSEKLSGFGT